MAAANVATLSDEAILEHLPSLTNTRQTFRAAMLEPSTLERDCPLDNARHAHKCFENSSLGHFNRLPAEVLHLILVDVDFECLTTLRRVSHGVRNTIGGIWQYKELIHYAPNSIRAPLSINVASWVSPRQLYKVLCSMNVLLVADLALIYTC